VIGKTIIDKAGNVLNINGWEFVLTVNREENPTDVAEQIAQMTGTVTDGPNGQVGFPPQYADMLEVGTFYFDIEATDATGHTDTIDKGQFIILQDITKQDVETVILLDTFGVDDTEIVATGENMVWVTDYITTVMDLDFSRLFAGTRDTRRVVRWHHPVDFADTDPVCDLRLIGDQSPRINFNPFLENVEFTLLGYIDQGSISFEMKAAGLTVWYGGGVGHTTGTGLGLGVAGMCSMPDPVAATFLVDNVSDLGGPAGWYYFKLWFEKGWASVNGRAWALLDDEPDVWQATIVPVVFPSMPWSIAVFGQLDTPVAADMIAEIAEFRFRAWR
jgi:hypothetical protein